MQINQLIMTVIPVHQKKKTQNQIISLISPLIREYTNKLDKTVSLILFWDLGHARLKCFHFFLGIRIFSAN